MILLLQPSNRHSTQPKVGEKEEEVGMGCGIQASRFRALDETRFFSWSNKQARLQYRDRHRFNIQQPAHGHIKHQEPLQLSHLPFCMSTIKILAGMFAKCHFTEPLQSWSKVRVAPKSLLMNSGWEQLQRDQRQTQQRVKENMMHKRCTFNTKIPRQWSATIPHHESLPLPGLLTEGRWAPLLLRSALWGWGSALNGLGEPAFSPVSHSVFILLHSQNSHLWKCQNLSLFWQICEQQQNRRCFLLTLEC